MKQRLTWTKLKKGARSGVSVVESVLWTAAPSRTKWCHICKHPTNKRYVLTFVDSKPPMLFDTRELATQMAHIIYELERS